MLNPALYSALRAVFGTVKVYSDGMRASVLRAAFAGRSGASVHGGEYYVVPCPVCGRTKLWISYLFGTADPNTGSPMYHLANCYRCGSAAARSSLIRAIRAARPLAVQPPARVNSEEIDRLPPVKLPDGLFYRVVDLSEGHPARAYLESRGMDVAELSRLWNWCYCHDAEDSNLVRRIFIPIYDEQDAGLVVVGYQTRAIPDFSAVETPKYYTAHGFRKSHALYNLFQARRYPTVVVVEGVTSAVAVGPQAVAILGKSMSVVQLQLLRQRCAHARLAVMLDADAKPESDALVLRLRHGWVNPFQSVVQVCLPDGDPGDRSRGELWSLIESATVPGAADVRILDASAR